MKKINIFKKDKYEAMGFVEALIAIMVVGAASVVLMDIASRTMQEVIQNETIDTMTQLAVEGAEMAQEVAKREVAEGTDLFPNSVGSENWCYIIQEEGGVYSFKDEGDDGLDDFDLSDDRDSWKDYGTVTGFEDYFRFVCIDNVYENYVIARVVVGLMVGDGNITRGNLVKDYEYLTVIDF